MKTKFDKNYIIANKGCYEKEDINKLYPSRKKIITLNDIIKSKIPNKDKFWFLWNSCNFNSSQREECYNQSSKIRKIIEKYYGTGHGWVCSYYFDCWSSHSCGSASEQATILNEILKYSKKFDK